MALPKMEGQIVIPTGGWAISVQEFTPNAGPTTVTVPAGTYYLSTTNGANDPLLTKLESLLDTDGTLTGNYSVAISDDTDAATGKTTISATGVTTFNITWTSTDLRDVLGYTGNLSAALTYTSTNHARFLNLPSVGRARPMAPEPTSVSYDLGARARMATYAESPDGRSVVLSLSSDRFTDTLHFDYLVGHKTWRPLEVTTNESMERFYMDVFGPGLAFRYHPDRSSDSVFFTQKVKNGSVFGPPTVVPVNDGWVGQYSLWNVAFTMGKAVGE